jgi:hypothetical protein
VGHGFGGSLLIDSLTGQSGARPASWAGFGGFSAALAVNTLKTSTANAAFFIPVQLLF